MNGKRRIVRWRLNGYELLAQACLGGIVAAWAFDSQAAFAASALIGVIAALLARRTRE